MLPLIKIRFKYVKRHLKISIVSYFLLPICFLYLLLYYTISFLYGKISEKFRSVGLNEYQGINHIENKENIAFVFEDQNLTYEFEKAINIYSYNNSFNKIVNFRNINERKDYYNYQAIIELFNDKDIFYHFKVKSLSNLSKDLYNEAKDLLISDSNLKDLKD